MKKIITLVILLILITTTIVGMVYYRQLYSQQKSVPTETNLPSPTDKPITMFGSSMLPTLKDGDMFIVNKNFDGNKIKRGDLVMYKESTGSQNTYGPKRVIAMGGDTLKLVNGNLYLNGTKLNENYLFEQSNTQPEKYLQEGTETKIPLDSVFLLGDNRQHSYDSRSIGPIKISDIVGLVTLQ